MSDLTEAQQQAQAALEKVMNCRFNNFDAGAVIHWAERGFYQVKAEAASRISQQDAELERLQALYDREKAAHRISVDEATAEARKAAFIEAAEIAVVFAGKHEPSYGLVNREIHEAILAVVGALRAKAEETRT